METCVVCLDKLDKDSSYLVCELCGTKICYECASSDDSLVCCKCKNKFNLCDTIKTLSVADCRNWITNLIQKKQSEANEDIKFASNLLKVYCEPIKSIDKETIQHFTEIYNDISHFIEEMSILTPYAQEMKTVHETLEKLKKRTTYRFHYNMLDDVDISLSNMEEDIKTAVARYLADGNRYSKDYEEFITLSMKEALFSNITEDINDGVYLLKIGYETDRGKLAFFKTAINSGWFISFYGYINIFPDEEGVNELNSVLETMTEKYPAIQHYISNTPFFIRSAYSQVNGSMRLLFNKTAQQIIKMKQNNEITAHPINKCEKCGSLVDQNYICVSCKTVYCKECMRPIDDAHICLINDINDWKLIKSITQACPVCGTRIEKKSGCNDMFCTNCHAGFDYVSGNVKEGYFHNPERDEWMRKIKQSNTHISPTFREFTIRDMLDFYNTLYQGLSRKSYRYVSLLAFLCNDTDFALSNNKDIYYDMYETEFNNANTLSLFNEEWKWFMTELLIKIGDLIETLNDAHLTNYTDYFKEVLHNGNTFINTFAFIINSCQMFGILCNILDMNEPNLITRTRRQAIDSMVSMMLMTRNIPTDVTIDRDEYEKIVDAVDYDIKLVHANVCGDEDRFKYIEQLVRMTNQDKERRKNKPDPARALSVLSSVLNEESTAVYIKDLIRQRFPSQSIDQITKYEICFSTHYFPIMFVNNDCLYTKGKKNITLYKSDLPGATIRFTIAGRAYKFKI